MFHFPCCFLIFTRPSDVVEPKREHPAMGTNFVWFGCCLFSISAFKIFLVDHISAPHRWIMGHLPGSVETVFMESTVKMWRWFWIIWLENPDVVCCKANFCWKHRRSRVNSCLWMRQNFHNSVPQWVGWWPMMNTQNVMWSPHSYAIHCSPLTFC